MQNFKSQKKVVFERLSRYRFDVILYDSKLEKCRKLSQCNLYYTTT